MGIAAAEARTNFDSHTKFDRRGGNPPGRDRGCHADGHRCRDHQRDPHGFHAYPQLDAFANLYPVQDLDRYAYWHGNRDPAAQPDTDRYEYGAAFRHAYPCHRDPSSQPDKLNRAGSKDIFDLLMKFQTGGFPHE